MTWLMTLATGALGAVDQRPRIYLEQVNEYAGKRVFVGVMRGDEDCIETAIDLNSWVMRKAGETGIHYACKVELPYPAPPAKDLVTFLLKTWPEQGEPQAQFVGNLVPLYCSSAQQARTEAYKRARFPQRYEFECSGSR